MAEMFSAENLVALLTLTGLEIVLGIDNIVFIAILTAKLAPEQRARARQIGLFLAMFMRIALLLGISWVMSLKATLFSIGEHGFSGRDLILLVGGLFLIGKATHEIHNKLEGPTHEEAGSRAFASFNLVLVQIILLDIVFSLDSVITAVGMARHIGVMIAAVVVAVVVMMIFAGPVSAFIERHPTFKMLGLAFLLLIGVVLVADGCGQHINKGYIYSAMAFSLFVEILNMRVRKTKEIVKLH
ncbi:MAG: TerC family protein [Phycisphaerales bacterium]|nr:TerC family protein [Phycisphaerales bacterium]